MKLLLLVLVSGSLLAYTNCSEYPDGEKPNASYQLGDPTNVNNFKEVPPPVICGKAGYEFMLRNYIRYNCGSCHGASGVGFPSFTATDVDDAYFSAMTVGRDRWIATVTQNRFCGPACNLSTTGEVFNGLLQWLDNKSTCP